MKAVYRVRSAKTWWTARRRNGYKGHMTPSSSVTITAASERRKVRMQARTRTRLWVALGVLLIVVVGVGIALSNASRKSIADGDNGSASATASETILSAKTPGMGIAPDTGYTTPPPADGPSAEDGRHFTYIKDVYTVDGSTILVVDYAQMLTGDEAAAAATAAGEESPPPHDYFIVDENMLLRTFPVDTTINVRLTSKSDGVQPEGYDVGFGVWQDMFAGTTADAGIVRVVPYWITVEGGVIMAIEEQYLP